MKIWFAYEFIIFITAHLVMSHYNNFYGISVTRAGERESLSVINKSYFQIEK